MMPKFGQNAYHKEWANDYRSRTSHAWHPDPTATIRSRSAGISGSWNRPNSRERWNGNYARGRSSATVRPNQAEETAVLKRSNSADRGFWRQTQWNRTSFATSSDDPNPKQQDGSEVPNEVDLAPEDCANVTSPFDLPTNHRDYFCKKETGGKVPVFRAENRSCYCRGGAWAERTLPILMIGT